MKRATPPGLLNRAFAASELSGPDSWCASHGATPGAEELGAGMLYYALTYSLRAAVCVCLGWEIWGSPNWVATDSWFRTRFPDVELVLSLTKTAHEEVFVPNGIEIDYLHIDADHHYEGVRLDFDLFAPLVRDDGVITLHDSGNYREPCGVPQLVESLRREGGYAVVHFPIAYGTALVKKNPE